MEKGILFSILASACFTLSNLLEKFAVDRMSQFSLRHTPKMFVLLRRSKLWLVGLFFGVVAIGFLVVSYTTTPIAVVQAILDCGLVALVVAGRLVVHEPIYRKEWAGLVLVVSAAVLVAATIRSTKIPSTHGLLATAVIVSLVTLLAAAVLSICLMRTNTDHSISFGITAGLLYGVAGLQVKGVSDLLTGKGLFKSIPSILATPYLYIFLVAMVVGLTIFQAGLQRGRIAVIAPLTNVIASVYVVSAGMPVFHDPVPKTLWITVLRFSGFGLVIVGTWFCATGTVLPGRATSDEVGSETMEG